MIFQFESYSLDSDLRELRRETDLLALEPQVFDILHYLIRNRERVVSKDDLIAAVWNGRIVSESTLTSRLTAVRHAVGDTGNEQRLIRTMHRKGLRFVGQVREEPPSVNGMLTTPISPSTNKPSIAVLPFENLSGDPEQAYIADGVVEEITSALSQVGSLFVIARNSAFAYKDRSVDIKVVSRELGVRYLLEGSVRRSANRIRITAQLIDALDGSHLWGDHYDSSFEDVFQLEDRITTCVIGILQPTILSAEIKRARRKRPGDITAYDYVLQSLPHWWAIDPTASAEALRLLQKAIKADPAYALPYALASRLHGQSVLQNWTAAPDEARVEALRLARTALALDNEDPAVLIAVCAAEALIGDSASAAMHIGEALERDPNSAEAWQWSGWVHAFQGRSDVAIEHFARAARLSPFDPRRTNVSWGIGLAHFVAGRYAEAIKWIERGLSERPEAVVLNRLLSASYALARRPQEARRCVQALRKAFPDLTISKILATHPIRIAEIRTRFADGLRKAGLPE